jgi:protoporphyrinogen oxidase
MSTGIIGAGPSGLSMAMFLRDEVAVFEAGDHPGGRASTFVRDGFTFDHGPHIMFSRNKPVLEFMVRSLGENVHQCRRNNKISFKGNLVKFPFENDLHSLPLEDNFECLRDFVYNPYAEQFADPADLEQWLLAKFGRSICEKYLFPYNRKVWNVEVSDLSMLWAERIPSPDPEDVIKSSLGYETEGYLHQLYYHYPLRGGYQAISEAWAQRVGDITYDYAVEGVRRVDGQWEITDGSRPRTFDRLVSTMPVHDLIDIVDFEVPDRVRDAASKLIVNPMFVVSLGVRGVDENQFTAVYFPEEDFAVNRISYPTVFSPHNAPDGAYSIQAEITCREDSDTWRMSDEAVLEHVVDGLAGRGLLDRDALVFTDVFRARHAYVVYDVGYEQRAQLVRDFFSEQGIELVGRFSYFEYINVDGAVIRAMDVAGRMNGAPVELEVPA